MQRAVMSGWGRHPRVTAGEIQPASLREIPGALAGPYLPRGQGRSYGDAGLPAQDHIAVQSAGLDRFLSFDAERGVIEAESGVTLERILKAALPRGFFLPVTPGTKFVSLGGAIASNVHGKNHHRVGSIEHFVEELEVATPMGTRVCSATENGELFRATVGGYGLTGFITRARLRLIRVESRAVDCLRVRAANLDAMFELFRRHDADYEYSVAWLDTLARGGSLGRGVVMLGNHARNTGSLGGAAEPRAALRVPMPMPAFLLNKKFLTLFNRFFYWAGKRGGPEREDLETFFYPLDRIADWNLLYGRGGFFQYQCVIPDPRGEEGMAACLAFMSERGLGAFLSVLKRCGDDHPMLPFCRRGYTLALDIPNRGEETLKLLDALDEIVIRYAGRVYLTKDARLKPDAFRAMYPEWKDWMAEARRWNPEAKSDSRLAERLELWR